jgi:hypothetical protein
MSLPNKCIVVFCLVVYLSASRSSAQNDKHSLDAGTQKPVRSPKVIFDQNDRNFYGESTERLIQLPAHAPTLPFGKFAVHVGVGAEGATLTEALESKPDRFDNLRTGYYAIHQAPGDSLNAFGLVMNADDPRNRNGDISFVIPGLWLPGVTMPRDRILHPWNGGYDSIEYSVDMRVPFANSPNIYHPYLIDNDEESGNRQDFAAPHALAGLYFEQTRSLRGQLRPPAFWIGVTLFDLRKQYAREVLTVDDWSGGTNYPIVTTAIGHDVYPDDGTRLPDFLKTPLAMYSPMYVFTLPGSAPMLTEGDAASPFRHYAFRITREHFLASIEAIRTRLPGAYGEHGTAPMSTDLSDWGLTHFNFDAEIFHRSTLPEQPPIAKSRAMIAEFKNLRVQQAVRSPRSLTVRGALEKIDGLYILGHACFDADPSDAALSGDQLANLRETPVSVELVAVDPSRKVSEISLGWVSARVPAPASPGSCAGTRNGHSFKYPIPLESILKVNETGARMIIEGRALLGSGKAIKLQNSPDGPLPVPVGDFQSYGKRLIGGFEGLSDHRAIGWACIAGLDDVVSIDILSRQPGAPDAESVFIASGYANSPSKPIQATWKICGSTAAHRFMIDLPPGFKLDTGRTLVAIARPGNYLSPSPRRPWDRQLPETLNLAAALDVR